MTNASLGKYTILRKLTKVRGVLRMYLNSRFISIVGQLAIELHRSFIAVLNVVLFSFSSSVSPPYTHTHTHTHIHARARYTYWRYIHTTYAYIHACSPSSIHANLRQFTLSLNYIKWARPIWYLVTCERIDQSMSHSWTVKNRIFDIFHRHLSPCTD